MYFERRGFLLARNKLSKVQRMIPPMNKSVICGHRVEFMNSIVEPSKKNHVYKIFKLTHEGNELGRELNYMKDCWDCSCV